MPDKLLEVKHLKKYFNTKNGLLHAVDDVSSILSGAKRWALWANQAAESPP